MRTVTWCRMGRAEWIRRTRRPEALAAKCARANFTSKWLRPSHRPPQRRPTLLLRVCIHYALGSEAAPRRCRRNKEEREKMKEDESTHTHTTNEILLGASVSDHPQNFATKEANLSPTHWQTPAIFFLRSTCVRRRRNDFRPNSR
jgi:hypothetical protein